MISTDELERRIHRELALIDLSDRRGQLEALLIEPTSRERLWDYGEPDERYQHWVVARDSSGIELVYCDQGFGPEMPWGFLHTDDESLGMDGQWSWCLEEAFVRSGLWTGPIREDEPYHRPPEERGAQRGGN
jgi:hypothetical protein